MWEKASVSVLVSSKGTWLSEQSPGVNLLLILRVVGWAEWGQMQRFHAGAPGTSRLYLGNSGWILHPP